MGRKLYISSTTDEKSYRMTVARAADAMKMQPILLEQIQLHGQSPIDVRRQLLEDANYYVHILGTTIGVVPPVDLYGKDNDKKRTLDELEFAFAQDQKMPCFYFWSPEAVQSSKQTLPQTVSRFSYALFRAATGQGFQSNEDLFNKALMSFAKVMVPSDDAVMMQPHFGKPMDDGQFKCDIFMVMPFRAGVSAYYDEIVKPVADELGLVAKRGDDFHSLQGDVMAEVWSAIYASRIVIVDCTSVNNEVNGNIYYELGIADTLGKPIILTTQDSPESLPFDVRHRRFLRYDFELESTADMRKHIRQSITRLLAET